MGEDNSPFEPGLQSDTDRMVLQCTFKSGDVPDHSETSGTFHNGGGGNRVVSPTLRTTLKPDIV